MMVLESFSGSGRRTQTNVGKSSHTVSISAQNECLYVSRVGILVKIGFDCISSTFLSDALCSWMCRIDYVLRASSILQ